MKISEDWRLLRFLFLRLFCVFFLFQQACSVAPSYSGVLQLRPPPVTVLPLFIAFLRHGHEVGGDAASEVKTIRAAAIGRERGSRPPTSARAARPLALRRRQSETYDL